MREKSRGFFSLFFLKNCRVLAVRDFELRRVQAESIGSVIRSVSSGRSWRPARVPSEGTVFLVPSEGTTKYGNGSDFYATLQIAIPHLGLKRFNNLSPTNSPVSFSTFFRYFFGTFFGTFLVLFSVLF